MDRLGGLGAVGHTDTWPAGIPPLRGELHAATMAIAFDQNARRPATHEGFGRPMP